MEDPTDKREDDRLTEILKRALARPPEMIPGLKRAPYRRGTYAANVARRKRRGYRL